MMARVDTAAVVLVPGLWLGSGWAMAYVARGLRADGFAPVTFRYPTVRNTLRDSAFALRAFSDAVAADTVHFVGHSLGGIIIRAMLSYCAPARPGRVVTLGSPHNGCQAAQTLAARAFWRWLIGAGIADLLRGTLPTDVSSDHPIGVIKGDLSFGIGRLFVRLPAPNDGVVRVEEGELTGATDTITLPVSHSGMLCSRTVVRQTGEFLRNGGFVHRPSPSPPGGEGDEIKTASRTSRRR